MTSEPTGPPDGPSPGHSVPEPAPEPPPTPGYDLSVGDEATIAREAERLGILASRLDRGSAALIARLGIAPGWHCLEVGTGQGSMARWMAEAVGPDGRVMATDLDLRFVGEVPDNVVLRQHDIAVDRLPSEHFDLAHARAVLQHEPAREQALANIVAATKPGGWVVIEDIDWLVFESQELPEPFASLRRIVSERHTARTGYDGYWGRRMLRAFRDAGLTDVESRGTVTTMHGGTPSAEWYVMALERARTPLVEAGLLDAATVDEALAQARDPDFAVLSPLAISAWGRKPVRSEPGPKAPAPT